MADNDGADRVAELERKVARLEAHVVEVYTAIFDVYMQAAFDSDIETMLLSLHERIKIIPEQINKE